MKTHWKTQIAHVTINPLCARAHSRDLVKGLEACPVAHKKPNSMKIYMYSFHILRNATVKKVADSFLSWVKNPPICGNFDGNDMRNLCIAVLCTLRSSKRHKFGIFSCTYPIHTTPQSTISKYTNLHKKQAKGRERWHQNPVFVSNVSITQYLQFDW